MYSHTPAHPVGDSPALSASVLATFPPEASRAVVASVVSPVSARMGPHFKPPAGAAAVADSAPVAVPGAAGSLGSVAAAAGSSPHDAPALKTESQIDWFMEVGRAVTNSCAGLVFRVWSLLSRLSATACPSHWLSTT